MNCRPGSIAGPELEMPPGPKLCDHTDAPVCASNAMRCPCSPCRYTRSRTPAAVFTAVSRTGAPSGASVSGTLNSCFSLPTLDVLIAVSSVLSADFCSSKANCNQSVGVPAGLAAGWVAQPRRGTRATANRAVDAAAISTVRLFTSASCNVCTA